MSESRNVIQSERCKVRKHGSVVAWFRVMRRAGNKNMTEKNGLEVCNDRRNFLEINHTDFKQNFASRASS
jgi:hypothetical protein